jgi:hypothetical protein
MRITLALLLLYMVKTLASTIPSPDGDQMAVILKLDGQDDMMLWALLHLGYTVGVWLIFFYHWKWCWSCVALASLAVY